MAGDPSRLSEREKDVLRLILRGHDAKSIARERGLSIHTVNERLRSARRLLEASSSREAARLLAAQEGATPKILGDEEIGVEQSGPSGSTAGLPTGWAAGVRSPSTATWIGVAMISTAAAVAAALSLAAGKEPPVNPTPRVVSTSPVAGSAIPAGPITLKVTFDRPMRPGSYSFVQKSADTYPKCANPPAQSTDRRTFTLRCQVEAGRRYEVWFNSPPYMNFVSDEGVPAQPFQLLFRAKGK